MAGREEAYVELFLTEARDHLEAVERDFLELEAAAARSGGDADIELLNRIFRAMHTIKGGAGMVGLNSIKILAHAMENVLTRMRDKSLRIEPAIVSTLLEGVDSLRFALANGGGGEGWDPSPLAARISAAKDAEIKPVDDDMAWFAQFQKEGMCVLPEQPDVPAAPVEAPIVPIHAEAAAAPSTAPAHPELPKPVEAKSGAPSLHSNRQSETLRVRVGLLDQLMALAGELVLVRNQHSLSLNREDGPAKKLAARLNLVTSEIQETVMRTRMQPMSLAYGKLSRLVRDMSRSMGKDMRFETKGDEVELDKTILEGLTDPLMHLVRNSCDHGVETPDVRKTAGKPVTATVFVRAQHEGGQMHIAVGDDGKGIDPEAIRQSAIAKGLRTADELSKMSPQEILSLIFLPGFSTAKSVTDVSGRGVGMDVVKSGIAQLGGVVEIDARPGEGTTFHLRLPLTLAIIPSLIIRTGGERFAIPQVNLEELVRLYGDDVCSKIEVAANAEVYRLRDRLLPVVRLAEVLARPEPFNDSVKASIAQWAKRQEDRQTLNILVLKCGSARLGLVVDEIVRNEDIVVTPMHPALKSVGIFSGTTIMGDGKVALIFDVLGLAHHAGIDLQAASVRTSAETVPQRPGWRNESLLLFKAGAKEQFGIPLSQIRRVEHVPVSRLEPVGDQQFVTLAGQSTRVIALERHLRVSPTCLGAEAFLILPRGIDCPVAILASSLVDVGTFEFHVEDDHLTGKGFVGRAVVKDCLTLFPDIKNILDHALVNEEIDADTLEEVSGDA